MKEEKETIWIYSYSKIWKQENKIYAIQNVRLPAPVSPVQLLYSGVSAIFMMIICKVLPFLDGVPFILKYIVVPLILSKFLLTKKLDGKNPIKYFNGLLVFLFTESDRCMERFTEKKVKEKQLRLTWNVSQGRSK